MRFSSRTAGYITIIFLLLFFLASAVYIYYSRSYIWCERVAYANDIGNLKLDNPIKVSGIIVGTIHAVSRDNGRARIVIRMKKSIVVKQDYALLNIDIGLMGDRCLVLVPGFSDTTVPVSVPLNAEFMPGIAEGISNAASLKYIVRDLTVLLREYAAVNPTNDTLFTTQFHSVLLKIDEATLKIENILNAYEPALQKDISLIAHISGNGRSFIASNKTTVQQTLDKTWVVSQKTLAMLEKLGPQLERLAVLLNETGSGKNMAGRIIDDRKRYADILATTQKIRHLIKVMRDDGIKLGVSLF